MKIINQLLVASSLAISVQAVQAHVTQDVDHTHEGRSHFQTISATDGLNFRNENQNMMRAQMQSMSLEDRQAFRTQMQSMPNEDRQAFRESMGGGQGQGGMGSGYGRGYGKR